MEVEERSREGPEDPPGSLHAMMNLETFEEGKQQGQHVSNRVFTTIAQNTGPASSNLRMECINLFP